MVSELFEWFSFYFWDSCAFKILVKTGFGIWVDAKSGDASGEI